MLVVGKKHEVRFQGCCYRLVPGGLSGGGVVGLHFVLPIAAVTPRQPDSLKSPGGDQG